jgi:hypothetical protein
MERKELQERAFLAAFGLISLALGVIFTLDYAGLVNAGKPWHYWPLLLIGMGVPNLIAPRNDDEAGWGVILTAVGTLFILPKLRLAGPILLILAGLAMVGAAWPGSKQADKTSDPGTR